MEDTPLNRRLAQVPVRRIAVIKPSALGDVVQTLPVLSALHARFPDAEIAWVINRELQDLLSGHPHLTEIIPFDRHGAWSDSYRLLSQLRQGRFDLTLDLQGLLRTGVMTWATRAPLRLGLETAREGSSWACHYLIPDTGRQIPAHHRYWRIAEALGVGDILPHTEIPLGTGDRAWAERMTLHAAGPIVVVHPGAKWATKRWPVEHFAEVVARATREFDLSVILVGGKAERPLTDQLQHLVWQQQPQARISNFAGETTIKQTAALLQRCASLLTTDSGPLHMAAAFETPVLGVFTCTDPVRSGPAGAQHQFVTAPVACAGSYCKRCPHSGSRQLACFQELTPQLVWHKWQHQLQQILPRVGVRAA